MFPYRARLYATHTQCLNGAVFLLWSLYEMCVRNAVLTEEGESHSPGDQHHFLLDENDAL